MGKKLSYAIGILFVLVLVGNLVPKNQTAPTASNTELPTSTAYTKSGNCLAEEAAGVVTASNATLHIAAEPTAKLLPAEIWVEECPDGSYFWKIGQQSWKATTKKTVDDTIEVMKLAGRKIVKVVD